VKFTFATLPLLHEFTSLPQSISLDGNKDIILFHKLHPYILLQYKYGHAPTGPSVRRNFEAQSGVTCDLCHHVSLSVVIGCHHSGIITGGKNN
jgi:hypothetical protein